jgi:hypothetical protein
MHRAYIRLRIFDIGGAASQIIHLPSSSNSKKFGSGSMPRHSGCNLFVEDFPFENVAANCPVCLALGEIHLGGSHPRRNTFFHSKLYIYFYVRPNLYLCV